MNILITGSASGIGQFLARHFLGQGHHVWGIARRSQQALADECAAAQKSFRFSQADIADWEQLSRCRQEIGAAWSHIDQLICCAGIQGPLGPAMSLAAEEWSRSVRINLDGTFYTIRAFYDLLLRHAAPRAKIFCLSGGGSAAPRVNFTPYASAKAGVVRLVENLAREWAEQTIDINAIAPGAINTAMTEEVLALGPAVVGEKEFQAASKQKRAGGGSLLRLAAMLEHLASPQGDRISGRLISVPWDPWENSAKFRDELAESDVFTLRRIVPKDRGKHWD